MREVNSSEQEDKEGVDSGLCRGAKIREWMSCALSLSLSLLVWAELGLGLAWFLSGSMLTKQLFPRPNHSKSFRSREIDDNDAKMADPVDGDDVSFIIS